MRARTAFVLAACACTGSDPDPEVPDLRFDPTTWPTVIGPSDRTATVVAPSSYDGSSLLPVLVELHGYGATALIQELYFQAGLRVDEGFVLVLPDGTSDSTGAQFWNATEACCDFDGSGVDDAGYLLSLVDEVEAAFPVDPDRIAFFGHSNGGYMSYRIACEASGRIAAVASLAGSAAHDPAACAATEPVSALQIHGTLDDVVTYDGDAFSLGAVQTAQRWADRAGCTATEDGGRRDYEAGVDGDETVITRHTGCAPDRDVELWTVEGADHIPIFYESFRDDLIAWLLAHRR